MHPLRSFPRPLWRATVAALFAALAAACADSPSKEAEEAAKNTFACKMSGERLVVKFDAGEARLLMPDGDRVVLYQITATSGVRYTNGNFDLRGSGQNLQLIRNGNAIPLADCQPILVPK